jgi:hypothetical protein
MVKTKKKATAETYAFWRKGQDMGLSGSVGERLWPPPLFVRRHGACSSSGVMRPSM